MKTFIVSSWVVFRLFTMVGDTTASSDMWLGESVQTFMGRKYHCVVLKSDLKGDPKWDDEKDPPPLSASKASRIAIKAVESQFGRDPSWTMNSGPGWGVSNVQLVGTADGDKNLWFYRVNLFLLMSGTGGRPEITLFLTLGGKVIPLVEMKTK